MAPPGLRKPTRSLVIRTVRCHLLLETCPALIGETETHLTRRLLRRGKPGTAPAPVEQWGSKIRAAPLPCLLEAQCRGTVALPLRTCFPTCKGLDRRQGLALTTLEARRPRHTNQPIRYGTLLARQRWITLAQARRPFPCTMMMLRVAATSAPGAIAVVPMMFPRRLGHY